MGGAGVEPALPPYQRGALPPELSAEWARLGSNQQPLVCKTSALPLELLARVSAPGQGVEPRSPRSERGVLPVRRSRNERREPGLSIHLHRGRSTQQASVLASSFLSRRPKGPAMFSMPLAYPSTLDRRPLAAHLRSGRRPTWRSFGARASFAVLENRRLKHTLIASVHFQRTALRVFLSQAGPRFDLELVQAEHHLLVPTLAGRLLTQKRRPVGSPSSGSLCR